MSSTTLAIAIPKEYGYVIATVASSFFVASWHGIRVGSYRKKAGIGYPAAYASASQIAAASAEKKHDLELFNCAQRGHANFLENYSQFLVGILVAGVKFPIISAGLGAVWLVSRVFYAIGYTNGTAGGRGRYAGGLGMLHNISILGFIGLLGKSAYDIILA